VLTGWGPCAKTAVFGRHRGGATHLMMRSMLLRSTFLALVAGLALSHPARAAPEAGEPCRAIQAQGESFTVCTVDLRKRRLRVFWRRPDGQAYSSLQALAEAQGVSLAFAMNGGMYDKDQAPVGLYVEDGRELHGVSTADGPGNFHLKPNGVFYVKGEKAGVLDTSRYLRAHPKPDFATQSGPMLVIEGQIHPKITADGPSQKIRNGVGARDGGHVAVFAISERPVSFGAFARLFRDDLGCRNALFLDGSVSSLYAPNLGRSDLGRPLGPLIGAVAK